MGISSPKTPPAPPPPPPVEYINTRDEVGGTESVYVTNPDGTKTLVNRALPLSAEEQAYQDNLKRIESDSLAWIEKLSTKYDRTQIPWLDQYLKDYETTQVMGADAALADRTDQEETALARYGQADSTAGNRLRAQRGSDYTDTRAQITRDLSGIEQGVRANELSNAQNLFALASGRIDTNLAQMANSLGRSQQVQLADAGLQQNRNLAIYQGGLNQQGLKAQASQTALTNLTGLAALATYAAGPQGFNIFGRKAA